MPILSTRGVASARGFGLFGAIRDLVSTYFFSAKDTSSFSSGIADVTSIYDNWYTSRTGSTSFYLQSIGGTGATSVAKSVTGISPSFLVKNNVNIVVAGTSGSYPKYAILNPSTGAFVDSYTFTTSGGTVNGCAFKSDTAAFPMMTMGANRFQYDSEYYVAFFGDVSSLGRVAAAIGSSGTTNYAYVTYIDISTSKVGVSRVYVPSSLYTPAISWHSYYTTTSTPSLGNVAVCAMVMNFTLLEVVILVHTDTAGLVITVMDSAGTVLDKQYVTTTTALSNISCTCTATYGGTNGLLAISATDSSDTYSAASLMFFSVNNSTGALAFYSAKKVTQSAANCYAQSMGFSSNYTYGAAEVNAAIYAQDYGLLRIPVNPSNTSADGTWPDQFKTNNPITVSPATYAIAAYTDSMSSTDPLTIGGSTYYYGTSSSVTVSTVGSPDHFYAMEA